MDEVLLNYPDDPEHLRAPGESLRRSLRRAGITRGSSGRFELPGSEEETESALEEATKDLWRSDRIRIFVSHTSSNRQQVGALATELNKFAFSCFVAHDEIEPSREWQDVIELALRTCDVLLAFVTPDFNESWWTDQEVGWALGRQLVVVPLRVGADPYGFFGAYQALTIHEGDSVWKTATAISRSISLAIFGIQRPGARRLLPRMTETAVDAFCSSRSYDATVRRFEIIRHIPKTSWTNEHVANVSKALLTNSQLRDCVLPLDHPTPTPEAVAALFARLGISLHA
ncbi:MAG: toll/interleukin-1 receptor domain-containing protein [Acidimicrobiales bacterium]